MKPHGHLQLNSKKDQGRVNVAKDTLAQIEDLTLFDFHYPSETFTAIWVPRTGADEIHFNIDNMEKPGRTDNHNKKTASHELGHALGVSDHYEDTYSTQIMYGFASSTTTLKTHEISDYRSKNP
ncbi:hypothetical protein PUW24_00355 (plasmid) [Paenibacillus urinalis]|uniref:hypothetical protein n=1 Tax=Paenibacillus urinalis TaxID=521520 RepID=UPI002367C726|nr:hypothetical protein [Paenibacillus urinalis]WDH95228.1 hypothetical protein PUW24_00355 [Paenibacillus urinalis]